MKRPVLSCTEVSTYTLEISVRSTISSGFSVMLSRATLPSESATSTRISRASKGFSSVHSTANGGPDGSSPTSALSTKNRTAPIATSFLAETCATMRMAPVVPVRPSGEVMRIARGGGICVEACGLWPEATSPVQCDGEREDSEPANRDGQHAHACGCSVDISSVLSSTK